MIKNTASQKIGVQMVSATDGSAFTGSVTVSVTGDAGTQATGSVGSGACTHEGNGYHTYAPAQAETNYTLIAFTFTGTGAVPATVQVFTTGFDPTAAQVPANVTQFGGSNGTFSSGRPEVNTTHLAGTSQTARDIGASVLLSSGTGTGQVKLSSGYVAPNWGDVGNPTTTVGLSGTTVKTATDVETDTQDIQSRLPAALVSGRMASNAEVVGDKTGYALTSAYDPAKTAAQAGDAMALTSGERTSVATAVWASATRTLTSFGTLVSDIWAAVVDSAGVTTLLGRLSNTRAGYLDNLSAGAVATASALTSVASDVTTLLSRITSTLFSGITSLAQWLGLIAGKQTGNSTARTELRATGAGSGSYDETTDSQEATRDNMGTAQTGDAYAIVNSGTHGNAALKTLIDDVPTNAELATALAAADDAVLAAIAALNNLSAAQVLTQVNTALDTQLADSIPADGTRPTLRQAIYMGNQYSFERTVSGTTVTVKKVDGSTTLFSLTINDATSPTSITRAA